MTNLDFSRCGTQPDPSLIYVNKNLLIFMPLDSANEVVEFVPEIVCQQDIVLPSTYSPSASLPLLP